MEDGYTAVKTTNMHETKQEYKKVTEMLLIPPSHKNDVDISRRKEAECFYSSSVSITNEAEGEDLNPRVSLFNL